MSQELLIIVALFLGYFFIHSLTASLWMKRLVERRYPGLVPYYRLLYNLLATLLALPLLYVAWRFPGEPLWRWEGAAWYLLNALALLAGIALVYSLTLYDMREFMGLRQVTSGSREVGDMQRFTISPLHRYVRHPWYFLILVILWTREMSSTQLLIYLLLTLYLALGSRLEERKLIASHGPVYAAYRKRVPGLFPLPWRYLTAQQARQLLQQYDGDKT